jgi:alpha-tubulin suppressor-like RCC1 family protein
VLNCMYTELIDVLRAAWEADMRLPDKRQLIRFLRYFIAPLHCIAILCLGIDVPDSSAAAGYITTSAGTGTASYNGDNITATTAQLNYLRGVAVDSAGNIYIADSYNHRIRKVSGGVITTVAGTGTAGYNGDSIAATSAQLNNPYGVAVDGAGNIFIADISNNRVRKVSGGVMTTVAGTGTAGYNGDGITATSAQLNGPYGVAADSSGNVYIAEINSHRVRKVSGGIITTVAGTGTAGYNADGITATTAQLNSPHGVATDVSGNLYIADSLNNRIRIVAGGIISTVAGTGTAGYGGDNGQATAALLRSPYGVAFDSVGNLYISDTSNHRIRKMATNGVLTTMAGTGAAGFGGDNGPAASAQLNTPVGVAADVAGNIFIGDYGNNRVRRIENDTTPPTGTISINGGEVYTASTSISLALSCSDPLGSGCASMRVSNDGVFDTEAWENIASPKTVTIPAGDGSKYVYVQYKDTVGNLSPTYTSSIILEASTPTVTITSHPPAISSTNVTFQFSASEAVTYECRIDAEEGVFTACSTPYSNNLPGGSHSLEVRATDLSGKVSNTVRYDWVVMDTLHGAAYSWGGNKYGQLAIGSSDLSAHPVIGSIPAPADLTQVSGRNQHSIGLRSDGTVWTWGSDMSTIPHPHPNPVQIPKIPGGFEDIVAVAAGDDFNMALKSDGTVWTWGYNGWGQLGYPGDYNLTPAAIPGFSLQVPGHTGPTAISAGIRAAAALKSDGTVWTWGFNVYGQLGIGTNVDSPTPVQITGFTNTITAIAVGDAHMLALDATGAVWSWGYTVYGALGRIVTTLAPSNKPGPVRTDTGMGIVSAIACGPDFSMAVSNGIVWTWGNNFYGQLGIGSIPDSNGSTTPVSTNIQTNGIIVAGDRYALAVSRSNTIYAWGKNDRGQLGIGLYDNVPHPTPMEVGYISGVTAISAGTDHSMALNNKWVISELPSATTCPVVKSRVLKVDAQNKVHIILDTACLLSFYATNASGSWVFDSLDYNINEKNMVIGSDGTVHLVYFKTVSGNYNLIHAYKPAGSAWSTEVVVSGVTYTSSPGLAIDNANNLYVCYSTGAGLFIVQKLTGGTWSTPLNIDNSTSVSGVGRESITIGNDGTVHIVYMRSNGLYYLKRAGSTWSSPALVISGAGSVHAIKTSGSTGAVVSIAYTDYPFTTDHYQHIRLKFITNRTQTTTGPETGVWTDMVVDEYEIATGLSPSLAVKSGKIGIAYYDQTNGDLKVATAQDQNGPTKFLITTIDFEGDVGNNPSLDVDSYGIYHIAYTDATNVKIQYATNADINKPTGSITITGTGNAGYSTTPAVTFNLTCQDGTGSGCWQMKFSNDNVNWLPFETFSATKSWNLPAGDGQKTVYVKFRDAANNWSNVFIPSKNIFLDTQAPSGTLSINNDAPFTNSRTVTLQTSCTDPGTVGVDASDCAKMEFSTDNGTTWVSERYVSPYSLVLPAGDGPGLGLKTIMVRYVDAAGNVSAIVPKTITLDMSVPTDGSFKVNGGAPSTNSRNVTLNNISCTDNTSGTGCKQMQFNNENGPWSDPVNLALTTSWTLSAGDGTKTVYARFIDNAGNQTGFSISASITLDSTPPTGSVRINTDATITNSPVVNLSLTCADEHDIICAQMKLSPDGVNWGDAQAFSGTSSGYPLANGPATLWSWGGNQYGQLGNGTVGSPVNDKNVPTNTLSGDQWSTVSASGNTTLAIKSDGTLWGWGNNGSYQLGIGNNVSKYVPTQVGTDTNWKAVENGPIHALALKNDGSLWSWGTNTYGMLGLGDTAYRTTPQQVPGAWKAISAGDYHSLAIKDDGTLWTWGNNAYGQLGSGTTGSPVLSPQMIAGTWSHVAAGSYSSMGIKSDGTLWTWGYNQYGQLGIGTSGSPANDKNTPQPVTSDLTWSFIASGGLSSYAIKADGSLWSWGRNNTGQLGIGTIGSPTNDKNTPQPVSGGGSWSAIAAGQLNGTGIKSDGSLWTWGQNGFGQIGCGTSCSDTTVPQNITTGKKYKTVSAGNYHVLAIPVTDIRYVFARFSDSLGNWSDSFSDTITYDATPPTGSITINNDAAYSNSWTATLNLSAADAYPPLQMQFCNTDTSTGSCLSGWSVLEPYATAKAGWALVAGEGTKRVNVRYVDAAGNQSAEYSDTIIVDSQLPTASLTFTGNPTVSNSGIVSLSVSSFVDASPIDYIKVANMDTPAAWTAAIAEGFNQASPVRPNWVLDPVEGNKTVYIKLQDRSGLWSDAIASPVVILDKSAPTGTLIINGGAGTTRTASVDLALTCNDLPAASNSGCSRMQFSNDGTNWGTTWPADGNDLPAGPVKLNWPLTPGDGAKTVYVRFMDTAGNWSTKPISSVITLDGTSPAGSIAINNGALNTASTTVDLSLSCSDATSGCSRMQFSNDGINWGTTWPADGYDQAVGLTKANWPLTAVNGTKTVSVRFYDAAGNPSTHSSDIFLDNTPPVTEATPKGSSSAKFTTVQSVSLTCKDGSGIDGDGTNGTPGCANTWYSLDGSEPTVPYTKNSKITIDKDLTLKFNSKDSLGNTESVVSEIYQFSPGYTKLSLELSSPVIDFNGKVTIFGRLQNMTDPFNNADPTGDKVTITVQPPATTLDPTPVPITIETTILNKDGQYIQLLDKKADTTQLFSRKGAYIISASFGGASLLSPSSAPGIPLMVGASAGYAILIEGKHPGSEGLASHNKTANRIYQKLKARGFVDDNIYYFNYDTTQTGVDAQPSLDEIRYAIQNWAKSRMNGMPAPLYIIMVDHGAIDKFYIDSYTDLITPHDDTGRTGLANWLGTLEAGLNATALLEKRVVIIGSCFSGSFISQLSKGPHTDPSTQKIDDAGRLIITSAAPGEVSYKGPQEGAIPPETVGTRSGEYFLEELFTQLERGQTIRQSFIEAAALTRVYTQQGGGSSNSNAPWFDGAVQHPLLDDNGDGIGSNILADDGGSIPDMVLGAGAGFNTNSALNPAEILNVTETLYLENTLDPEQFSAPLWATVNDDIQVDSGVWVEVRPPSVILSIDPNATGQANLNTVKVPMLLVDHGPAGKRYEVTLTRDNLVLDTPPLAGRYDIYYFVRDASTRKLAPMKHSVVYHRIAGNPPPPAPDLTNAEPPNGESRSKYLYFGWGAVSDSEPPHPPISYSLIISEDANPTYANAVYFRDNIPTSNTVVGPEGKLSFNKTYYWKVRAIDRYGAWSDSVVMTFDTFFDQNADVVVLQGSVKDAASSAPIGASVTVTNADLTFNRNAVADVNGSYYFSSLGITGPLTVTTTATGYSDTVKYINIVSEGKLTIFPLDIGMSTTAPTTHSVTVTVTGSGSGSVTSSPQVGGSISCIKGYPDNCSAIFPKGQVVELVKSISSGSIFGGWSDCCSGSCPTSFGLCQLTVSSNKTITAAFISTPPVFVYSASPTPANYCDTLTVALGKVASGGKLQLQSLASGLSFSSPLTQSLTIMGGYDADFSQTPGPSPDSFTTIQGALRLQTGTVRVQRIKIK